MPAWRTHGEDYTYGEAHRTKIRSIFGKRTGHRTHAADRDFTEACAICREPLAITEHVIHRGQDIRDKGTSITSNLASRAGVPSYLVAMQIERSEEHEKELAGLHRRIIEICTEHTVITGFLVRPLTPKPGKLVKITADEWFTFVGALHKKHWEDAHRGHPYNEDTNSKQLWQYLANTPLALPTQPSLWTPESVAS